MDDLHPQPSRVAARHMERQGAIFTAPPKVVADVSKWMKRVYAGHVLALTQARLGKQPDEPSTRQVIEGILKIKAKLPRTLKQLRPSKSVRFRIAPMLDVGVKSIENNFGEQMFFTQYEKPGRRMSFPREYLGEDWPDEPDDWETDQLPYSETLTELLYMIDKGQEQFMDLELAQARHAPKQPKTMRMSPKLLVEQTLIEREAKRYATKPKKYVTKAVSQIPVDLTGWKYTKDIPESEVDETLGDLRTLTAVLWFKPHSRRGGQWSPTNRTFEVDMRHRTPRTLEDFQKGLAEIDRVVRHEAQHVGQTALWKIKGARPGKPSQSLKSPYRGRGRPPHAERDVEFYPRLADEVERFTRTLRSKPKDSWRDALTRWVDTQETFRANKKNTARWRKLVSEFVKAVGDAGYDIPQ